MGCCGVPNNFNSELINHPLNYNLESIDKNFKNSLDSNDILIKIYSIMETFENIREKIVDYLDILILKTGACCFVNPTIIHVLYSIWYKISYDLNGKIEDANIKYIDDSPYMQLSYKNLKNSTLDNISLLFEYINNLRNLRIALKNLDSNIAELIYFVKEYDYNDINKYEIEQAVKMFPELDKFYNSTIKKYKRELMLFYHRKIDYCYRINLIGLEGIKEKERIGDDVYKLIFLYKTISKAYPDELFEQKLYYSEKIGKKTMQDIINSKQQKKKHYKIKSNFNIDDNYEDIRFITE
jgi:hypothetical protein